jgi:hypothetical protein
LALGWLVSAAADRAFAADVVTPSDADKEKVMSQAPPGARQYYDGYWFSPPIIADPLANWQPHKPPWQFCHNESYLGNSWRAALLDEVKKGVTQLAKQGLAKPDVMVTNSNGDINVELSQLRSQIAQGCNVIISFPGSATGLCSAIEEAADKGILFIAIDSQVSCRGALNVAQNPYYYGKYEGVDRQGDGRQRQYRHHQRPARRLGDHRQAAGHARRDEALSEHQGVRRPLRDVDALRRQVGNGEVPRHASRAGRRRVVVGADVGRGRRSARAGRQAAAQDRRRRHQHVQLSRLLEEPRARRLHARGRRRADGFRRPPGGDPRHVGSKAEGEHDLYADPCNHQRQSQGLLQARHDGAGHLLGCPPDGRLVPDDYFDQFFTGGQPQPKILP